VNGVIIAVAVSVSAALGCITAVLGLLNQRRTAKTAAKVDNISVQVDGRLSTLLERQSQLLEALHAGGVPIPDKPAERPVT
jgi:hypothetical protein